MEDHKRLIHEATLHHRVPYSTYKGLMNGVIYPDMNNSYRLRKRSGNYYKGFESHHNPEKEKIIRLIWNGRSYWLDGMENDCGFLLGQALHYIHDGVVGKGILGLFHDSNEKKINNFSVDDKVLSSGINESLCDPIYVENLIHSISPQNPQKAIDKASYITASLIKAVCNNQSIPPEVEREYIKAVDERKSILGFIISKIDSRNYNRIEKRWKWFNNEKKATL